MRILKISGFFSIFLLYPSVPLKVPFSYPFVRVIGSLRCQPYVSVLQQKNFLLQLVGMVSVRFSRRRRSSGGNSHCSWRNLRCSAEAMPSLLLEGSQLHFLYNFFWFLTGAWSRVTIDVYSSVVPSLKIAQIVGKLWKRGAGLKGFWVGEREFWWVRRNF